MPNWCDNEVAIDFPDKTTAAEFMALVETDDDDQRRPLVDAFLPMPSVLDGTRSPFPSVEFDSDGRIMEFVNDPNNTHWTPERYEEARLEHLALQEKGNAAFAATGFTNWYDWANKNWGTKWGDCQTQVSALLDTHIDITFATAWGPLAASFWMGVSRRFPTAQIRVVYKESGMGFQGAEAYYGGISVYCDQGDYTDFAWAAEVALEEHVYELTKKES